MVIILLTHSALRFFDFFYSVLGDYLEIYRAVGVFENMILTRSGGFLLLLIKKSILRVDILS